MAGPSHLKVVGDSTPMNLWQTQELDAAYDEHEFYTRSVNKHDHSESIRLRLPRELLAELASLVASGKVPAYRTQSDVLRDALNHRLHWLSENYAPELVAFVSRQLMLSKVEAYEAEVREMAEIVQRWETALTMVQKLGDKDAMARMIDSVTEQVEQVREPYAGQLEGLARRFK